MALFGKMFEKKNCVICGKELGLFGKTKLSEGYICKDCDGKLSPYFRGYRSATADDIRQQLAYREANAREVATFTPTTTIDGGEKKLYLDENQGKLILTSSSNWRQSNPDIISLEQVTGCDTEVRESKTEIKRTDREGNEVSYNPPRYDIDYDIYVKVYFSHPYFSEVSWKVNRSRIERKGSAEYCDAEDKANAVRAALTGIHRSVRAAAAPKQSVTCPNCLATTMPDANGCCEYCGGSLVDVIGQAQPQQESYVQQSVDAWQQQDVRQGFERGGAQQGYGTRRSTAAYDDEDYGEGYDQSRSQRSTSTGRTGANGQVRGDYRRRMNQ